MDYKETFKGFRYFWKGLVAAKREMWVSLQVLIVLTLVLSILLFSVEHNAQPEKYNSLWDSILWSFMNYLGNPGKFAPADPITIPGRLLWIIIAMLKIAIFAIPAGLIAKGFQEAFAKEKREKQLTDIRTRLAKAFRPKQCRYTHERTEPRYVSLVDIQAKQHIDLKDIMDAVNDGANYRLRNLATTQNVSEHPVDKLVIEHFPITEGTPYGCLINRQSNITIVSTSSIQEAGIGNFSRLIADFGGFNYISKEIEVDEDNPVSFYVVDNPEDEQSNCKAFIEDVKALSSGKDKWVIFLISASGAEEPQYPTHFHFIYGAKKGDEGYSDANLTICDTERFDHFYQSLTTQLQNEFNYESDRHRFHTGAGKKNIARRIGGGSNCNAFTIRPAFRVTVWDDHNVAIAKTIAEQIKTNLQE